MHGGTNHGLPVWTHTWHYWQRLVQLCCRLSSLWSTLWFRPWGPEWIASCKICCVMSETAWLPAGHCAAAGSWQQTCLSCLQLCQQVDHAAHSHCQLQLALLIMSSQTTSAFAPLFKARGHWHNQDLWHLPWRHPSSIPQRSPFLRLYWGHSHLDCSSCNVCTNQQGSRTCIHRGQYVADKTHGNSTNLQVGWVGKLVMPVCVVMWGGVKNLKQAPARC